jgi:tetratricopeptide (TPR) repeat protein
MFSNFYIPVAGIVGERLVFNASIGFSLALGVIVFVITKSSFLTSSKIKAFTVVLTCIVLLAYSSKTISRNNDWKDRHTLFTADIGHLQNSVKANDITAALLYGEVKKDIDKNRNLSENLPKLNKVIGYYSQALKIYPEHFNASYNIGFIYLMYFRDYDNAIVYLENTIKINKDFMEAYPDLSYAYSMKGNFEKAIELAKIPLSKDANNITYIAFLADLYLKKGDFQSCAELNKKIISLNPNGDIGYIAQGNLFAAKGDTTEAVKSLEKAFEKNRTNKNTIISLYNIYIKAGNEEKSEYYKNLLPRQR